MKYLCCVVACFVLSACSFFDTDVEFKPTQGEERRYQVYSITSIEVDNGRRTETLKATSHQLIRYKVTDTGTDSRFEVHIDYMHMRDGQGSGVNSTNSAERNPEMHALFSQGFEFTANLRSGNVTDYSGLNKPLWQALLADRGAELEQEMQKLFGSATFVNKIPATVGATVQLPAYQGQADVTLTVLRVTDTHVLAKVESEQDDGKFYGQMLLERERGWLVRLTLIVEAPFERYGYSGTMRSNIMMFEQQPQSGDLSQRFKYNHDFPAFEYEAQPDFAVDEANVDLTEEQVFPFDSGYFQQQDQQLHLVYQHDFTEMMPAGEFQLTNITARNAQGEILPLQLEESGSYSYPDQNGLYKSVRQNLLAGWNAPAELLQQVAQFSATAQYTSAKIVTLSLTPDPAKTVTAQYKDLQLELAPVAGEPLTYHLISRGSHKQWLLRRYDGAEGATVQYLQPHSDVPDWLSEQEQTMVALAASQQYENRVQFTFKQLPASLTLYVNAVSDNAVFSKDILFVPEQHYGQKAVYPPAHEELLYLEDMYDGIYDNFAEFAPQQADPALLDLQRVNNYGVSLQLSAEQAAVCTLSITQAPEVNGHKLQWVQVKTSNNLSGAPDKHIRYMLSTADGIRRNFYGIKVSSNLTCAGTPQWQTVAYQPEQNWLIDISQLPDVDTTLSVSQFMQRYRFLNVRKQALAPLISTDSSPDFYQQPLQQVLQDGRWFALAGRSLTIEQLITTGEPVNKQWHTQFPALP
ncbi:hypothetical protein M2404_002849 [Rheinheimera pacifica]|uniref:hypothetical protein n=1 Tax=Rheinheimera pacifica TaxID=173990 RepID=UPI002168641D|nr:hypothetical protein [Rheinheimera pacifica]MCS4308492.1 hypothetical protein [Rheinheimera pacifica]